MIAVRSPVRSINTILLGDGREIHLDDIETAVEGQAILDAVDAAIDDIEVQLSGEPEPVDWGWRRRAEIALKKKRRSRPRLQQRIGELRRAERIRPPAQPGPGNARRDARRKAFIHAAEQLLDRDLFVEIWTRAEGQCPEAFAGPEVPDPILAAIALARAARARHIATCDALLHDDSDEAQRTCNASCAATTCADDALSLVRPATAAGLLALVEWYAEDADGSDLGAHYLERLLAVMKATDSAAPKTTGEWQKIGPAHEDSRTIPQPAQVAVSDVGDRA